MTGTTNHTQCPKCGNYTVDSTGECHYAYCDEIELTKQDDADAVIWEQLEREWSEEDENHAGYSCKVDE